MQRLERRGFVSSTLGEPTPERGGRRKRLYRIRPAGERAIEGAQAALASWHAGSGRVEHRDDHEPTSAALDRARCRQVFVSRTIHVEGLVMASLAGAAAYATTRSVPAIMAATDEWPRGMFMPDWRVALMTAGVTGAAAVLVSLAPSLQTTQVQWRGGSASLSGRAGRLRSVVLASQIAVAVVLVLSATLIARGIVHGVSAPADFALQSTVAAEVSAPGEPTLDQRRRIWADIRQAVSRSDLRLGISTTRPVSDRSGLSTSVRPPGTNVDFRAHLLPMTASAFDVLDVPLVQGRWASDDPDDREVVINELLAGQIWPDRAALGKRLVVDFDDREVTVVGVTRNAHLRSLSEVTPLVHTPPLDGSPPVILAEQVPALDERLRALVAGVGPELTVTLTPLSSSVIETMENVLVGAGIASGLGSVALLLAVIGVFGVFSYVIEERRKEIGVRLALGAGRREVRAAMLRASRGAILGGLAAGLILSLVAGFALRSYLFGLSPLDPTLRAE